MKITAWTNGKGSYGFKISKADRDAYFEREWGTVKIYFPDGKIADANVDKDSFWNGCRELISSDIKRWLCENNHLLSWEKGNPPKFEMTPKGNGEFVVNG